MRHQKSGRALGIKPAHRHALMRNAVTSLLEHERIRTTLSKAKELRKPLDRMITLGKQGDLSARRQALGFVKTKEAMKKLFGELAERYKGRSGGYSRILALGPRRGDAAQLALILLVDGPGDPFSGGKAKPAEQRRRRRRAEPAAEQAAEPKAADTKPAQPAEP